MVSSVLQRGPKGASVLLAKFSITGQVLISLITTINDADAKAAKVS